MARRSVATQVSRRMEHAARGLKPANRPAIKSAALVFRDGIEAEFARNGLRARQSKLAGSPWKGVLVRDLPDGRVEVRAANPAHLFNNPTAAHFVVAAGVGGSRRSRATRLGGLASRTVRTVNAGGERTRYTQQSRLLEGPVSAAGAFRGLRQTKASARGKKALKIGGNLRLYARHRGTRGRPSFGAGRDRARDDAARAYLTEQRRALNWGTTR